MLPYYCILRYIKYCIKLNKFVVELIKPIYCSYYGQTSFTWLFSMGTSLIRNSERGVCDGAHLFPSLLRLSSLSSSSLSPSFSQRDFLFCMDDKPICIFVYMYTYQRLRNKILMMVSKSTVFHVSYVTCSSSAQMLWYAIQHMPACDHVYIAYERDKNG